MGAELIGTLCRGEAEGTSCGGVAEGTSCGAWLRMHHVAQPPH